MYIPPPAKLLFTVHDDWDHYFERHGDDVSLWTRLAVERMLACGTYLRPGCSPPLLRIAGLYPSPLLLPKLQDKSLQRLQYEVHGAVDCCAAATIGVCPAGCRVWATSGISASGGAISSGASMTVTGKYTSRRKPGEPGGRFRYLGQYLKQSPVSASRLRNYAGGAVVHHYFDHRTGKHKRRTLSQE